MPSVKGIVESAVYVADLDRAREFYQRLFGFAEIQRDEGRLQALGVVPGQVLLLFRKGASVTPSQTPGGTIPPHDGRGNLHFAFGIGRGDVPAWRMRLTELQIPIESEVDCPSGGHSIYFRDPDGHCVELITPGCWSNDLDER